MAMNSKHLYALVLPKDVEFANKLTKCMWKYMDNMLAAETSEEYERWYKELNRCAEELLALRKAKEDYEVSRSYHIIITDLRLKGVKAELVTRRK